MQMYFSRTAVRVVCAGFSRVSQTTMIIPFGSTLRTRFHKKRSHGESGFPGLSSLVNAGEYARLWKILPATLLFPLPSSFLPLPSPLSYTFRQTSLRRGTARLTWLARKGSYPGFSTYLGVRLQTRRRSSSANGGESVVGRVVTRGRIRGEWTSSCYQLGASRLPRADKLLHPH